MFQYALVKLDFIDVVWVTLLKKWEEYIRIFRTEFSKRWFFLLVGKQKYLIQFDYADSGKVHNLWMANAGIPKCTSNKVCQNMSSQQPATSSHWPQCWLICKTVHSLWALSYFAAIVYLVLPGTVWNIVCFIEICIQHHNLTLKSNLQAKVIQNHTP